MFEGIKKKFSNFIDSIKKKEEEKVEEEEKLEEKAGEDIEFKVKPEEREVPKAGEEPGMEKKTASKTVEKVERRGERPEEGTYGKVEIEEGGREEVKERGEIERPRTRESKAKVTTGTKLKGIILGEVRISERDLEPFLEELKYSLLGSDVNYDAAEKILESIRKNLVGKPMKTRHIEEEITGVLRQSILSILDKGSATDIIKMIEEERAKNALPFRILFIGPNGAGKTTTLAKIAHMLTKNGISCVIAASDTFRAAAIEQTVHHANKIGVNVIKGVYGADPASIAFDAIAHARAHGIDAVLIDSAGRQETNKSLMEEVKKIVRIAKPNLKIFVGESIAGNTLLNQVREFKDAIGLNGVILTKLDCDAKGGNTLSVLSETSVPVLYFGTGEKYEDIKRYDPNMIIDNIV